MAYEIESKSYWGLNFIIVLLAGVLFAVLIIPTQIWEEEEKFREESRKRMENLWKVETTFLNLTGEYTELGENAIHVVNAVYDSLKSGTDFYGDQQLALTPKRVMINANPEEITHWGDSTLADTSYQAYWTDLVDYYNSVAVEDSTNSGQFALMVLHAAYDSVTSDTNWTGQRTITLPFEYEITVQRDYTGVYDTTFVREEQIQTTVQDTSFHAVITVDEETGELDTTWVPKRDLSDMEYRYPNMTILDTSVTTQTRWITKTSPNPPREDWLYGPLTGKKYHLKITGDNVQHLRISSPIEGEYTERRYFFFTFSDTSHGFIEDGEPSWEE